MFRKPKPTGDGYIDTIFTFDQIPSSYQYGDGENDGAAAFEPEVIGTDDSPVASADGTKATLRLVCLSLPPFAGETSEGGVPHAQECPAATMPMHHQP